MAKQKETTKKKKTAPKKAEEPEDGGNDMGLSTDEMQQWLDVQQQLQDKGYGPEDVERELLKRQPKAGERAGAGLMASARTAWNAEIRLKHVIYGVVAVVGFIGFMKIIAMAFNWHIPILNNVIPTEDDLDI
jgi:hypothetical protein